MCSIIFYLHFQSCSQRLQTCCKPVNVRCFSQIENAVHVLVCDLQPSGKLSRLHLPILHQVTDDDLQALFVFFTAVGWYTLKVLTDNDLKFDSDSNWELLGNLLIFKN